MYRLLEILEKRLGGDSVATEAWIWVVVLGLFIILGSWTEAWMHWIVNARLGQVIRTQLSAEIFCKAMRRKDLKGAHATKDQADEAEEHGLSAQIRNEDDTTLATREAVEDEDDQDSVLKGRQATINLVAIDAKRIGDFLTFHYIFSQTIAKLTVSVVFLLFLIGWKALLCGLAITLLSLPLNIWAARSFSAAQGTGHFPKFAYH